MLLYIVGFIFMFMQVVGIARIALGLRRGPSWFYFSLDRPMWRLTGSILLLMLAVIVGWIAILLGGLLLGFLLGLIAKLANSSLVSGLIALLVGVGAIALWCGYIYSVVRLSFLLTPVVVAEPEGFALERSWSLGRGNFWRIFVVLLAVFLPFLLLEGIFVFGFMLHGVSFPAPHASPEQIAAYQAAINAQAMAMMAVVYRYWYIAYPVGIVFVVLFYGLAVGAPCFAYRRLTENDVSAPIAGGRLPDRQRRQRGGVGAQDARAQGHRHDEGPCSQHFALGRIEAAFRAGKDGGRSARATRHFGQRPGVAALVAEIERALLRPGSQHLSEVHGLADLRHRQALGLFRRLDGVGRHAVPD